MRWVPWVVAAILIGLPGAPARGQPFADTPVNHWAYEALAQLAAKGLIEG